MNSGRSLVAGGAVMIVAGCSADIAPSRAFDPAFFIGSKNAEASANGLAYADGSQALADTEEKLLTVRLVRFERDPVSGETVLVATDETATLPATFTDYGNFDATITLDGNPLAFVGGEATLPSGQKVWSYLNYRLVHSGTGGVYTYASLDPDTTDAVDMEGFFVIGHETDPAVIAGLGEQVRYVGSYFGYVQTFDTDGILVNPEMRTNGAMTLEAEFARARVSGRLEGRLDPGGDERNYELIFLGAPIQGNGFVGAADLTCPADHTCASRTSVGGAFFGPNGEEITGVIALDETIVGPDGYSFVGAAGFSTTNDLGD